MQIQAGKKNNIHILRAANLGKFPWLVQGFSPRTGGCSSVYGGKALNLGFTREDEKRTVERNRAAFLRSLEDGPSDRSRHGSRKTSRRSSASVITLRQIHSDVIHLIAAEPESPLAGDGMITAEPGLLLGIQTADCLPVILVDAKKRAVGVFHAGWGGTFKRIVEKGVGEMRRYFGSNPRDLRAAIGPGIHGCCYEVGEEIREKFRSQFSYAEKLFREAKESDPVREKYPLLFLTARAPGHGELPNKIFLDLVEANRQQLMAAGVPKKNIEASELCTNCRTDLLFSYRAEKGRTGRMMAVVGIRAGLTSHGIRL